MSVCSVWLQSDESPSLLLITLKYQHIILPCLLAHCVCVCLYDSAHSLSLFPPNYHPATNSLTLCVFASPPAPALSAGQTVWTTWRWFPRWSSRTQKWTGSPSTSAGRRWTAGCTGCSSEKEKAGGDNVRVRNWRERCIMLLLITHFYRFVFNY